MKMRKNGALLLRGRYPRIVFSALQAHPNVTNRELSLITSVLKPLEVQNKAKGFVTASDDAGRIKDCIQKIEHALALYQVSPLRRCVKSSLIKSGVLDVCHERPVQSNLHSRCTSFAVLHVDILIEDILNRNVVSLS
jgi:hypothetical protein